MPRPRRLPTVLPRAEVTALLAHANPRDLTGHRDRCLMPLMLHAGLRAAEVLALTAYDVDWLSGQLTMRQGKGKQVDNARRNDQGQQFIFESVPLSGWFFGFVYGCWRILRIFARIGGESR